MNDEQEDLPLDMADELFIGIVLAVCCVLAAGLIGLLTGLATYFFH